MRVALGLTMLVVLGIKAAVFPLFSWLPDSYPTAPSPVTAVFAGLLTKVGVYAVIRTQTLLFPGEHTIAAVLLVLAVLTMVVGILGALVQDDVKRVLSFTIVSHIGYMLLGLGLSSAAGLAGAVLYTVHHIVVQTTLFLVAGLVERREGTSSLDAQRRPAARGARCSRCCTCCPPCRSPASRRCRGSWPSSACCRPGWPTAACSRSSPSSPRWSRRCSPCTPWGGCGCRCSGARWRRSCRTRTSRTRSTSASSARRALMLGAAAAAVVGGLLLTVVAGPLYGLCARAADDLLDRDGYVQAVLDREETR